MKNSNHYYNVHNWLKYHYGNALECCFCDGKKAKRFEWALRKGCSYEKKIENFMQLCPSCHRKYDITGPMPEKSRMKISAAKKGVPVGLGKILTEEHKKNISKGSCRIIEASSLTDILNLIKDGVSLRKVAIKYNTSHTIVGNFIKRNRQESVDTIINKL